MAQEEPIILEGNLDAPIVVVCDPPSTNNFAQGYALSDKAMSLFARKAEEMGFEGDDFVFITPCPPIPNRVKGSDARERDHLKAFREHFLDAIDELEPRCIITLGKHAIRQVANRAVHITKVRGVAQAYDAWDGIPVLPMVSPNQVLRFPDDMEMFETDFHMLAKLDEHDYNMNSDVFQEIETTYRWCFDLQFLIDLIDTGDVRVIAVDCEATGLDWYRPEVYPITVQLCWGEGQAVAVPLDIDYWNMHREAYAEHTGEEQPILTRRMVVKLVRQLRMIMGNPNVHKAGHNGKIDHHYLRVAGIHVVNWSIDTMLWAFLVDENMKEKSLDECVRRWVPALRGYADQFNKETNKSRMIDVSLDKMLTYGCGDVDATLRLSKVLYPLAKKDKGQWRCYQRVMKPAMDAFMNVVEPEGLHIDTNKLADLQVALDHREAGEFQELMRMVPAPVKRRHVEKGLKFTRSAFVRDILFSEDGFNLVPRVFTKSTMNLPDDEKVASISAKDHLPYFEDEPFVAKFMDYTRLSKMRSTYVGHAANEEEEATGFWKYVFDERIHPSFLLHRTVTGRCLTKDARVITNRGSMTMEEIGVFMQNSKTSLKVLTHKNIFKDVQAFISNGRKRIFEITTTSGKTLRATGNHPLWTENGWVEVSALRAGLKTYTFDFIYDDQTEERWRNIQDDPRYQVSNQGRVWFKGSKYNKEGYLNPSAKGMWGHVKIKIGERGHKKDLPVHVAVCEAFHGPRSEGMEVLHLNGVPADNRASNLAWGTSQQNADMMIIHGCSRRGERSNQYRLTDEQLAQARILREDYGMYYQQIADRFEVSEASIRLALTGKRRKSYISPFELEAIVSITPAGVADTYDLTVEDDHSFIADGFVVHNSASANPNAQNFPKRGRGNMKEVVKSFRRVFSAPPGWKLIECDLSQAELRIAAWMAGDRTMIDLYASGADIHAMTAASTMGMSLDQFYGQDKDTIGMKRFQAKAVNFGFLYGMWWRKFMVYAKTDYGLDYTEREAQQLRETFFSTYTSLADWHESTKQFVRERGYVRALHGAVRHLPNVFSPDDGVRQECERQAVNSPVQRFASDLGLMALGRMARDCPLDVIRPVAFIHDALVVMVREDYAEEGMAATQFYMETPPLKEWFDLISPVPILSDVSIGDNLADMEESKTSVPVRPDWYQPWEDSRQDAYKFAGSL